MSTSPQQANLRALSELRLHPDAALVPEMPESEYGTFCLDLEARGLQVPLDVTEAGVVLDGRARLRAAKDLGWKQIEVRVVAPTDEVEFMLLAAIRRRQLDASQRAAIALELEDYEEMRDRARTRQRQNLRQHAEVATSPPRGKTRERIAAIAGVSARTAQDVITVYEHDRALFEQVKAGKVAAPQAARRVRQAATRRIGVSSPPPLPGGPFEVVLRRSALAARKPGRPLRPREALPHAAARRDQGARRPGGRGRAPLPLGGQLPPPAGARGDGGVGLHLRHEPRLGEALDRPWALGPEPARAPARRAQGRTSRHPSSRIFPTPSSRRRAAGTRRSRRAYYELIERMYPRASKVELFAPREARGPAGSSGETRRSNPSRRRRRA